MLAEKAKEVFLQYKNYELAMSRNVHQEHHQKITVEDGITINVDCLIKVVIYSRTKLHFD